ncbi:MAG TPA: hypothetical protein GX708_01265 [Gallicola sp.]|nr:hypothetical protein [Gallicola sp.]
MSNNELNKANNDDLRIEDTLNSDIVNNLARARFKGEKVVGSFIRKSKSYIMLFLLTLVLVAISFLAIDFTNGITVELLINMLVVVIAAITAFLLFVPDGRESEKAYNKSYQNNSKTWSALSYAVQTEASKDFNQYCKDYTESKREDIREALVKSVVGIDYETDFKEKIQKMSNNEFKEYINRREENGDPVFTRNQKRLLKKARSKIKVAITDPTIILLGAKSNRSQKVGTATVFTADKRILTAKLIKIIGVSLIIACISIGTLTGDLWTALGTLIIRATTVYGAAIAGFYAGISTIRERNEEIKENNWFLTMFIKDQNNKELTEKAKLELSN